MRSPTYLLTCVLGLATNLGVASTPDRITVDAGPIYSSLDFPFFLHTDEGFNISLRYSTVFKEHEPILSTGPRHPAFVLKEGILTTKGGSFVAHYGPTPAIYPPLLLPLRLSSRVGPNQAARFVAVTEAKGLRLWALLGSPVVQELSEGQAIHVKPEEPTQRVRLRIVPIKPRDELDLVDYDEHDDQEYLGACEL